MTSRPDDFVRQVPGVAATLMGRRAWTANDQKRGASWRFIRRKKKYAETAPNPDHAGVTSRTSAGIATRLSYAGRLIAFNLVAAVIHLAMLRWIFLPIGG
jgi:hypothetical protein